MSVNNPSTNSRRLLWCLVAASLAGFIPAGLWAQAVDACGPAPAVKAALDELPSDPTPDQTEKQFREQKLAKIQALLRQYPDDLFAQRAYISFQSGAPEQDKLIEQYKALQEKNPNDPRLLYLYAVTLVGRQSPEAIKLFESALMKDSKFAWPHLSLAIIYTSPNLLNKEKAVSHVKSFLDVCSSSFEGYEQLARMDDRPLMLASAQKLRELLSTRSDPDALGAYRTLWSLEFKAHPPSEHDPLRKQVEVDLKRLRALNLQDKRQWYEALEEGYKLVNDQKQSDWAKEERQRRFPTMWELAVEAKWFKDHPYPGSDNPAEKKRAYYSSLLKGSEQWLKERPNTTYMWMERLDVMEHLDDVPAADVEAACDQALKVADSNAGPRGMGSDDFFNVAEVLSKKKLQPARVVELVRKGLEQLEIESKQPPYDLWANKERLEESNFYRTSTRVQALTFETQAYLELGETEKSQAGLAQINQRLQEQKSLAGTKEDRLKEYSGREALYLGLMAHLAELQNRKLDAMAYYENGLLTRLQAGIKPETGEKDELADNALKLWNTLGGSEEGWKTWYARPAAELAAKSQLTWEKANEPLASFELADVQGKTWRVADLKGKVTLLNFWASW